MRKVTLVFLLLLGLAFAEGEWELVGFENSNVTCIAQHPQDTSVVLAALADSLFQSTDGGDSWSFLVHFNGLPINRVMYDPTFCDTVYALIGNGSYSDGIYRSTNGGNAWSVLEWFLFPRCMVIPSLPPFFMLVGCDSTGIFKTEDGGSTWLPWNNGLTDFHIYSLAFCNPFDSFPIFYAGTTHGLFYKSWNGWIQAIGIPTDLRVSSISYHSTQQIGFAAVTGGSWSDGIYRSTDYGQSWQVVDWWIYPSCVALNPLWQYYPSDTCGVFAGDSGLGVKYSSDCGNTWQEVNSGLANLYVNALSFHPQDSMRLFAATQGGLYRYGYQPGIVEHVAFDADKGFSISKKILRANEPVPVRIDGQCVIEIFDATGRAVRREWLGEEATHISPIQHTGVYYVLLSNARNSCREKIIIIE